MDIKIKRKLDTYKNFTYNQIIREALVLKGSLRRKQDLDLLELSKENPKLLYDNKDLFFQKEVTKSLSKLLGINQIDISKERVDKETASFFSQEIIKEHGVLPLSKKGNKLFIAVANPLCIETIENLPQVNGYTSNYVLSERTSLNKYISDLFTIPTDEIGSPKTVETQDVRASTPKESGPAIIEKKDTPGKFNPRVITLKDNSPVSLINTIFRNALAANATDIHLEPLANNMRVRFRVDGLLFDKFIIPKSLVNQTISRIKVLSNLDITETRFPQDGRMSAKVDELDYHLRVATMPTKMGESIVFRIIQQSNIFKGLEHLGLNNDDSKIFKTIISKQCGMVLVTGPIGSGKTTSLYTALNELDTSVNKVVTIEDPVECLLPGISQIEIDPKIDVNFVNSLRAVLRQDADIIMVGEIRDTETAKIAVRAALTGQLVFSTLHAVDTISTITTLRNFEVPPFLIASAINGIITQRLVRKICEHCKISYQPATKLLQQLNVRESDWDVEFAYGKGCDKCSGIGFNGRIAIFEIFKITEKIKDAIINEANENELRKLAFNEGLKTLHDAGVAQIIGKVTAPEEVMREIFLKGGKL